MSLDIVFIMLRHVHNEDSAKLWRTCYSSIRQFYTTNLIVIIDSQSNYLFIDNSNIDSNTVEIKSELPNGRLYAPFYYYLKYFNNYSRAVIVHDSTVFQRYVSFANIQGVKFLWHFETHAYDNRALGHSILNELSNNDVLHKLYDSNQWHGCLGCMCVIQSTFLTNLELKYNILRLANVITTKEHACEFERVLSVLCTHEIGNKHDISLFGDISTLEWGLSYNAYIQHKNKYNRFDIVKLFAAR